jgi:hypothetical protein
MALESILTQGSYFVLLGQVNTYGAETSRHTVALHSFGPMCKIVQCLAINVGNGGDEYRC